MGQRMARKEVAEGLRLYDLQRHERAVGKWRRALRTLHDRQTRFTVLGYLASAHCDWGRYRDMLAFSVQQIGLAQELNDTAMFAEAYLNLARSNEKLCEYHKALSYCRHSLQHQHPDPRVPAYTHLTQAQSHLGSGHFVRGLAAFERAMRVASQTDDPALELQVYIGLGKLFTSLKDYEKGLSFHLKAVELAKTASLGVQGPYYRRLTLLHLAIPHLGMGNTDEAMQHCEEALKMALSEGDRPMQATCLWCLAEIHRKREDFQRAYPRYEAAISIMAEIGDRMGQIEVLAGMAKTMVLMKRVAKQCACECQALEYNAKALDVACSIGSKLHQVRCHARMSELYASLGDREMAAEERERATGISHEMELICGVCEQPMGDKPDNLHALPCCHILHARCASQIKGTPSSSRRSGRGAGHCPKCRHAVASNSVYL